MMDAHWLWGIIAIVFGWRSLKAFRKGPSLSPGNFIPPFLGWWFLFDWGSLYWRYGGSHRLVVFAFCFLAIAPLLGSMRHIHRHPRVRTFLIVLLGLSLGWISYRIAIVIGGMQEVTSFFLGLGVAVMVSTPYKKISSRLKAISRQKQAQEDEEVSRQQQEAIKQTAYLTQVEKMEVLVAHELFSEAKTILDQILRDHPERAHYIAALRESVLARETHHLQEQILNEHDAET